MSGAFRAYDIRGTYPDEINEEIVYKVGRATVQFLKAKKILVGRDCRTSSLALKKSFVYGITDQGCDVIDTGYCNTPMCYYASQKMNAAMITASHNPKQYNGIKITKKGVEGIGEKTGLKQIEKMTHACHFPTPKKLGKVTAKNILPDYVKEVHKIVNGRYKPLRVLIDCGNGMAGHVVPKLMKGLPIKYDLLYGEMDGTFPNHTPNPVVPENTAELQKLVKKKKYDLGIAYDSDCDRVFFIDEKGRRIRPEYPLILFARHLMKKGQNMVYSINMSRIVQDEIKKLGGKAIPSMIGHTEIPLTMKKIKGIVAGEITGHYYFKKFKYADSGDISALMMLAQISKENKKVSEIIKPFEKYATTEETNFLVKDKKATMKQIEKTFKDKITSKLDGLTIDTGEYWFNVRLSKTENYVRLNLEANTQTQLKKAMKELSKLIKG